MHYSTYSNTVTVAPNINNTPHSLSLNTEFHERSQVAQLESRVAEIQEKLESRKRALEKSRAIANDLDQQGLMIREMALGNKLKVKPMIVQTDQMNSIYGNVMKRQAHLLSSRFGNMSQFQQSQYQHHQFKPEDFQTKGQQVLKNTKREWIKMLAESRDKIETQSLQQAEADQIQQDNINIPLQPKFPSDLTEDPNLNAEFTNFIKALDNRSKIQNQLQYQTQMNDLLGNTNDRFNINQLDLSAGNVISSNSATETVNAYLKLVASTMPITNQAESTSINKTDQQYQLQNDTKILKKRKFLTRETFNTSVIGESTQLKAQITQDKINTDKTKFNNQIDVNQDQCDILNENLNRDLFLQETQTESQSEFIPLRYQQLNQNQMPLPQNQMNNTAPTQTEISEPVTTTRAARAGDNVTDVKVVETKQYRQSVSEFDSKKDTGPSNFKAVPNSVNVNVIDTKTSSSKDHIKNQAEQTQSQAQNQIVQHMAQSQWQQQTKSQPVTTVTVSHKVQKKQIVNGFAAMSDSEESDTQIESTQKQKIKEADIPTIKPDGNANIKSEQNQIQIQQQTEPYKSSQSDPQPQFFEPEKASNRSNSNSKVEVNIKVTDNSEIQDQNLNSYFGRFKVKRSLVEAIQSNALFCSAFLCELVEEQIKTTLLISHNTQSQNQILHDYLSSLLSRNTISSSRIENNNSQFTSLDNVFIFLQQLSSLDEDVIEEFFESLPLDIMHASLFIILLASSSGQGLSQQNISGISNSLDRSDNSDSERLRILAVQKEHIQFLKSRLKESKGNAALNNVNVIDELLRNEFQLEGYDGDRSVSRNSNNVSNIGANSESNRDINVNKSNTSGQFQNQSGNFSNNNFNDKSNTMLTSHSDIQLKDDYNINNPNGFRSSAIQNDSRKNSNSNINQNFNQSFQQSQGSDKSRSRTHSNQMSNSKISNHVQSDESKSSKADLAFAALATVDDSSEQSTDNSDSEEKFMNVNNNNNYLNNGSGSRKLLNNDSSHSQTVNKNKKPSDADTLVTGETTVGPNRTNTSKKILAPTIQPIEIQMPWRSGNFNTISSALNSRGGIMEGESEILEVDY